MPLPRAAFPPLLLLLAGCAVGPDYKKPAEPAPAAYAEPGPWKVATPKDALPKDRWWQAYGDPALDALETQTTAGSPTLAAALARVDEAAAVARVSRAQLFPSVSANLNPSRIRYSGGREEPPGSFGFPYTTNSIDLPLALSYEIDLFGRARRGYESALALAQAQEADYQNVLLSLQALAAEDYFTLRSQLSQLAILAHTVDLRRQELGLVGERRKGGAADDLDVYQAQTELDSVISDRIAVDRQIADSRHVLAVLSGRLPEDSSPDASALAGEPPPIPVGLPSELLERRPDVAEAERRVAAANAGIGVAKAAFFPSVNLTAFAGLNSTAFNTLFQSGSREWGIAPFVSLPLFTGGANSANYQRAKAAYEEAAANYRGQVLVAFQDVENALSDLRYLGDQGAALHDASSSAEKAAELSEMRYKQGVADYFEVIDAQRTALDAELQASAVQGQQFISSVLLVKALGGGW